MMFLASTALVAGLLVVVLRAVHQRRSVLPQIHRDEARPFG
jgi:heme exporter protein D